MIKKVYCPRCGKWLFSIKPGAKGTFYVWCRQCRQEIRITIEP